MFFENADTHTRLFNLQFGVIKIRTARSVYTISHKFISGIQYTIFVLEIYPEHEAKMLIKKCNKIPLNVVNFE